MCSCAAVNLTAAGSPWWGLLGAHWLPFSVLNPCSGPLSVPGWAPPRRRSAIWGINRWLSACGGPKPCRRACPPLPPGNVNATPVSGDRAPAPLAPHAKLLRTASATPTRTACASCSKKRPSTGRGPAPGFGLGAAAGPSQCSRAGRTPPDHVSSCRHGRTGVVAAPVGGLPPANPCCKPARFAPVQPIHFAETVQPDRRLRLRSESVSCRRERLVRASRLVHSSRPGQGPGPRSAARRRRKQRRAQFSDFRRHPAIPRLIRRHRISSTSHGRRVSSSRCRVGLHHRAAAAPRDR